MKNFFQKFAGAFICLLLIVSVTVAGGPGVAQKPKLIVGIVVDQMRFDYLTRYWDKFGKDGFRKLVTQGATCINTHFDYIPTYTAPGLTSIYTGTTPSVHGVISNNWYDRTLDTIVYVTDDSHVSGTNGESSGKMSPAKLLTTTVTDELRIYSNFRSKVIGVALKDRSAILPAGYTGNAAYWFDSPSGNWISSSWYMKSLPKWAQLFNAETYPAKMLKTPWKPLLPLDRYTESTADSTIYEEPFAGESAPVFPHDLSKSTAPGYELIKRCPAGNTFTKDFALAAMRGENLGKSEFTDFLAISFSSTDYVGHQFGTHAIETEDTYLRLDQDLADLIEQVENYVGKGNVLFFLTADHGALPNPVFLNDHKVPAGFFNYKALKDSLMKFVAARFGSEEFVSIIDNDQVFLNREKIASETKDFGLMCREIADWLITVPGISRALTRAELTSGCNATKAELFMKNGFNPTRSGDVFFMLESGYIEWGTKGTTHGSGYTYDTHVPLLFYGPSVNPGVYEQKVNITDIAPTLSLLLGIQPPSGCTGEAIMGMLKYK